MKKGKGLKITIADSAPEGEIFSTYFVEEPHQIQSLLHVLDPKQFAFTKEMEQYQGHDTGLGLVEDLIWYCCHRIEDFKPERK